ncbi:MAG: tRNA pseudouridine(38-40) synthase TruA [Desulfobulbaceae bacterium]|jgi:tRNA pseudouridine38-40 synthase|nr:tRNA pseudouridine(38-40) synthase TruA [Desulfobulbaceae bacterium]
MAATRNICLIIAYDGSDYQGWQRQAAAPTIQGEIEERLSIITTKSVTLHGAGRTDAGVHAAGMTANFHTNSALSCLQLQKSLNSMLPPAIRIIGAKEMTVGFHARFSCRGKRYCYYLDTAPVQPPFLRRYALHVPAALDDQRMQDCLNTLLGTHDFSSFENSGSRDKENGQGRGAVRTLFAVTFGRPTQNIFTIELTADGFLRNMVRNIVGTLLLAGEKKISVADFAAILAAQNRTLAGATVPPHGLFLKNVLY